jgi:hypothetical protein
VFADTVWMKNGDRLSGKIKVFDGGKLLLETRMAGRSPGLERGQDPGERPGDAGQAGRLQRREGQVAEGRRAGKVTLANGEAPKTVELASIEQIMKPKPLVEDFVWKGNVDVALDYKRAENDTDDYDVGFKTTAATAAGGTTPKANTTARPRTTSPPPTTGAPSTRWTAS